MIKKIQTVLFIALATMGLAQWEETDYFDFGEDRSSHDYSETGSVSIGAYECTGGTKTTNGTDSTIRIGGCNSAGEIQLTLAVRPETDSISIQMPTPIFSDGDVYLDGVFVGRFRSFNAGSACDTAWYKLGDLTPITTDGEVVMRIVGLASCAENPQPTYIKVTSKPKEKVYYNDYLQTDYFDFGEDRTSHEYVETGRVSLGAFECTGTTKASNGTDSTIRVGSCSEAGSVQVTLDVLPNVDSIILLIPTPTFSDAAVFLDGVQIDSFRVISPGPSCSESYFKVGALHSITFDGKLVLKIAGNASCSYNPQITYVKVFSKVENVITSLKEEKASVVIYPNPSSGEFQISGSGVSKLSIYNLEGQLVDVFEGEEATNFSVANAGLYTVIIQKGNEVIVERIIKL